MWGLGCLVWESYNGPLRNRTSLKEINNVRIRHSLSTNGGFYIKSIFDNVLDSEIGGTVILWISRRKSVESTESSRYNNEMPETRWILQEWFGRHVAVPRRNPNQRQGWKIAFFQFNDCATRQFSTARLQVRYLIDLFGGAKFTVTIFMNTFREKILPQLITAYEYGDAGSAILPPMFKVGFNWHNWSFHLS